MLIALDYDGTYTVDPVFWGEFVRMARKRGHEVILVTNRSEVEKDAGIIMLSKNNKVYFTAGRAKEKYMDEAGIKPDIWIDDSPYFILNDAKK